MSQPHAAPTRSLPEKPSFVQLRKQAKDLLKAYRAGKQTAVAEIERFERSPTPAKFALADAQRVLARAYGFASWNKLRLRTDGVNIKAFCEAVDAGDVARVRKLAKACPDLVSLSPDGEEGERIALHAAVLNRDAEMTRVLMELGSDARRGIWPHRSATTAHTIAKDRGYDDTVAIIEREEERRRRKNSAAGATISSKTDEIMKAILHEHNDEAIRLLESDLSLVGACSTRGATPLHVAAWAHNTTMIAWLLDRGAPVDAEAPFEVPQNILLDDAPGKTPLDYAAIAAGWSAHGKHPCYMENSHKGPTVFDETVRLLRAKGARLTARAAVATGDAQSVRQMHREGRLRNEVHHLRGGLLSIAVRVNRPEMISLLLDLRIDPDEAVFGEDGSSRTSWGMPLWFAALCGRHALAELLLSRGADVNAIVYASGDAWSMADDDQMMALLRKHGARLTVEHVSDRETAKAILEGTLSAHSLNVVNPSRAQLAEQMLLSAGSSDAEIVRMCLQHITLKRDDHWWHYALMRAALPESVKAILGHGVHPDVGGEARYTVLHHLMAAQRDEQNRMALSTMLLDAGASLKIRDPMLKSTPLGWACRWGRPAMVHLFLARGADAIEPDAEAWATPLAWATKGGHQEIIELLRSRGAK